MVPLADLDQLVFGAWDPIADDAYEAALKCGVLNRYEDIEPIADFLKAIKPMPAAFDGDYVKRISGLNVKAKASKFDMVESLREDIRSFKSTHGCERLVMIYAASTEKFITEDDVHQDIESFVGGLQDSDDRIAPSMLYAYAAIQEGIPFINGSPSLAVDIPALERLAVDSGGARGRKGLQDGPDLSEDRAGAHA